MTRATLARVHKSLGNPLALAPASRTCSTSASCSGQLLGRHPWPAARRPTATQRLHAALLPAPIPVAHVAPVGAQLTGDLCLGHLAGEQLCRSQAELFLGVTVAAWPPARALTALLGRHDRWSHTSTSMSAYTANVVK
jgi:hypothetical protein